MSAFNVIESEMACPVCGKKTKFEIQFKYGDTWQNKYQEGEMLEWGGNDIGKSNCKKVRIEGIGGPCNHCHTEFIEFDIYLENDVIVNIIGIGKERDCHSIVGYEIIEDD